MTVRTWFSWLLMFGVIAGLWGRVMALDHSHRPGEVTECSGHDHGHDSHDNGCHDHDPGQGSTDDHSHDGCPPGPHDHHSHSCCHPAPLAGGEIESHRLPAPSPSLIGVTWWTTLPPESPVFELDKPPLI